MPRYSDQWLIDRTLFDYVQGGSCACCSFNFMPSGTAGLIQSLSEFETDSANNEVAALDKLPWPADMKDQVWMERVRLRQFCKSKMKLYKSFWNENGEAYETWFLSRPSARLRTLFQLPRSEIVERLKNEEQYHFHASFGTVLCAVTEQVANFQITCYPVDGRGEAEIEFEDVLTFDRRAGFTLKNLDSDETKQKWLLRHKTLGGPKLLERNNKKTSEEDEEGESDDDDSGPKPMVSPTPSFRSDRRITRLLIARHFADVLQRAFLKDEERTNKQRDNSEP